MIKKKLISACLLSLRLTTLQAQSDTVVFEDSIHLSKSFLKELDNAFSFSPMESPISLPQQTDTALLHEWVGKPDNTVVDYNNERRDTSKYTREYVAYKVYLHDLQPIPIPPTLEIDWQKSSINNGKAGYYYKRTHTTLNGCAVGGFDFNKMGSYLRPKENRLRKSRAIADKYRAVMDKVFPLKDSALYEIKDKTGTIKR